jgi:hypothetical protein
MRIRSVEVYRCQLGWRTEVFFTETTADQFTDPEFHTADDGSRWFLLSLIKGYLAARRFAKSLRAKPGEREAKGWSA